MLRPIVTKGPEPDKETASLVPPRRPALSHTGLGDTFGALRGPEERYRTWFSGLNAFQQRAPHNNITLISKAMAEFSSKVLCFMIRCSSHARHVSQIWDLLFFHSGTFLNFRTVFFHSGTFLKFRTGFFFTPARFSNFAWYAGNEY